MHLGHARTALLAWLVNRARGGRFVLRIEDLDRGRCREAWELDHLRGLEWLGLDWDEGPGDAGGEHGPYRQSERTGVYEAALASLDTYPCSCSRRELRERCPIPEGQEPVYDGRCRAGPTRAEGPHAIRWRARGGQVRVVDGLRGTLVQHVEREVGDFVLRRADGEWAYQLAVVVDDAAMGIDEVVRGGDLFDSTPRQVALQRALGLPTPRYVHAPLIVDTSGRKLSKRDGATGIEAWRASGGDPRVLVGTLARSLGVRIPEGTAPSPRELLDAFDPGVLAGEDGVFESPAPSA